MIPRPSSRGLRLAAAIALAGSLSAGAANVVAAKPASSVQLRVLRLVDHSRTAHLRNGTSGPRVLVTDVWYPAQRRGPFPLVVFAHGFALTPHDYTRLLETWARAGYVVAAPVFPVENANAPGGADRGDLANEPGDMSFVISRLTGKRSPLHGLVDPKKIAVAGQSDGGVATLSVAYDRRFVDRRIDAAMILSGSPLSGFVAPPAGSPPLLAVQGTLDPFNSPASTSAYYRVMHRPKFLLWLLGASHREPYSTNDRWAPTVDRATTAFLDRYLHGAPLRRLISAGTRSGIAHITSNP